VLFFFVSMSSHPGFKLPTSLPNTLDCHGRKRPRNNRVMRAANQRLSLRADFVGVAIYVFAEPLSQMPGLLPLGIDRRCS